MKWRVRGSNGIAKNPSWLDKTRGVLRLPKLPLLRLFLRCGRCAKLQTGLKFRLKHAWKLTTRTASAESESRRGLLDRRHLQDGDDLLRAGVGASNRRDLFDESRVGGQSDRPRRTEICRK